MSEEIGDECRRRTTIHFLRLADLDEFSTSEYAQAIRDCERFFLVMRDEQGSRAALLENSAQLVTELVTTLRIDVRQRLIETYQPRARCERPRKRHTLLLSARQLVWIPILESIEAAKR